MNLRTKALTGTGQIILESQRFTVRLNPSDKINDNQIYRINLRFDNPLILSASTIQSVLNLEEYLVNEVKAILEQEFKRFLDGSTN